jgi:hypothetical protein
MSITHYIENGDTSFDAVLYYGGFLLKKKDGLTLKTHIKKINNVNSTNTENNYNYYYKLSGGSNSIVYEENDIEIFVFEINPPSYDEGQCKFVETYKISIKALDTTIIEKFIQSAQSFYDEHIRSCKKDKEKVNVYMWDEYIWEILHKNPKRDLKTLYFENSFLDNIKNRIDKFIDSKTEERYKELGIPYKLNMLFEGLPGTGKTSLIYGLASYYNMNIAILNFDKDITDTILLKCLKRLPENTILILEDIDVLFKERKEHDTLKSQITFSGLLNSLDGIGSPYKQITIMTTNYKCNLDKALRRPGRVDMTLNFTYSTKKQAQKMFNSFFPKHTEHFKEFYEVIRNIKYTTATLQQYLFQYFNLDDEINIKDVIENLDELKELANEHSYDNQLNVYI